LKKISSKNKIKTTLYKYLNRGINKNGQIKGKQVHMELILRELLDDETYSNLITAQENLYKILSTAEKNRDSKLKGITDQDYSQRYSIEQEFEEIKNKALYDYEKLTKK